MTVRELIEELNNCPADMLVHISAPYDGGFGQAGGDIRSVEKEEDIVYLCSDYS